jgi:hypothetical protein
MTSMSFGKVMSGVLKHYEEKLKDAAKNTTLSLQEQRDVESPFLQEQLDTFRSERPGKTVRVNNVAGAFTGRLEVVVGDLLDKAVVSGSPVQITSRSVNKIENAEVRSLARQMLARGDTGPGLGKLSSALKTALTGAEERAALPRREARRHVVHRREEDRAGAGAGPQRGVRVPRHRGQRPSRRRCVRGAPAAPRRRRLQLAGRARGDPPHPQGIARQRR